MDFKMPKSQEKNLSKLLRISGLATLLVGTSILAGPAVAYAQDCLLPGSEGKNILIHIRPESKLYAGSGSSGVKMGEVFAILAREKQNSEEYVKAALCVASARNPGKNIMIIQHETYKGPENLTGVTEDYDIDIGGNGFDVFAFDTGSFTNHGDMGYQNWAWSGTGWTRSEDKRTVTFSAP